MRKIAVFITLFFSIGAQYFSIPSTHAGIFGEPEPKIHICTNNDCTVHHGADALGDTLNGQITDRPFSEYIQEYVGYLLTFLTILAVLYVIWAGFQILTSNGDEERVKQSKSTILYVALGIIIIWLAYSIVSWIMRITTNQTAFNIFRPFQIAWIDTAHASYTENTRGTFLEYKSKIRNALEELEAEMRLNKKVSVNSLTALKQLVHEAFDRLPDADPKIATENQSIKRATDLAIDLAIQKPDSTSTVSSAIRDTARFINGAKIEIISGNIIATPTEGHAPMTVSFRAADIKDPSGATPPPENHIWWMRESGGKTRILGRGPSLSKDFTQEGTFTVFLDVISANRNSKGKIDVLPFSASKQIEVKPKLGEIILLVNGVNVSNLESLKISPAIANQGLIFDASASRSIGNGKITETIWDFGNGNRPSHKGPPIIERQVYANPGNYSVKFSFKTNDGQTFKKELQLIVRDPSALIKLDKEVIHVGESITFGSEIYYGESKNIMYTWDIQDEDRNRELKSANGTTITHTFDTTGTYLVTLQAKSPNNSIDTDSRIIRVESRPPVVALDPPKSLNQAFPNTFVFSAEKSYNPDTNSRKNLTYEWSINGKRVQLENTTSNGARGEFTFDTVGENTVSVTVSNNEGKVATADQTFHVKSILSASINTSTHVARVGDPVDFTAHSPSAEVFTWNMGDNTPIFNSSSNNIQHSFQQSGIYTVSLTVSRKGGSEQNTVSRKVYITDMTHPLAIIQASNTSNSIIEEEKTCQNQPAWIVNRGEQTIFDAGQSINTDGRTSNLEYTWRYMGKVSTNSRISENFGDLGCFPIELTVRSKTSGASNTIKQFMYLRNRPPELTSISTTVDDTKKDSQKVIVKATANGVHDPDGVVTSYIWYYTTESDPEPQNIQISQNPHMTFILPNITEKYYFGVILEDNDGVRVNSSDIFKKTSPLIIDNANGNIYMPLITLSASKTTAKIGENIRFNANAKTIIGTVVTNKSQYAWDFDGDGRIDERTSTPNIEYAYKKAGSYNMRVRVTHNGVSNTKYQTIHIKNELKADVQVFRIPGEKLYLLNTSQGTYEKVSWKIGDATYNTPHSLVLDLDDVPVAKNGVIGTLIISHNDDSNSSHADILIRGIQIIEPRADTIQYQSFPVADDTDTITLQDPQQKVHISLYGNEATRYVIDTDIDIDSVIDGTTDNDIDNKDSPSYTDGSLFIVPEFTGVSKRKRDMKITLYNGDTLIQSKIIHLVFDFVNEETTEAPLPPEKIQKEISNSDKEALDSLYNLIRELNAEDRIVVMQKYNILLENWESIFERTKSLIDIQEYVSYSHSIDPHKRTAISENIDAIIRSGSEKTNEIDLAIQLIRNLIPDHSNNAQAIHEKLDLIASHPLNTEENRKLGEEILVLIQNDSSIEDKYKLHIKNQLSIIKNGGGIQDTDNPHIHDTGSEKGLLDIIGTIFFVFFIILGILILIFFGLYMYFRATKKENETGFQDFLIDRIFHKKPQEISTQRPSTTISEKTQSTISNTLQVPHDPLPDPLTTYTPPTETTSLNDNANVPDPLPQQNEIPDWLKGAHIQSSTQTTPSSITLAPSTYTNQTEAIHTIHGESLTDPNTVSTEDVVPVQNTDSTIPDWLKPLAETQPSLNTEKSNTLNNQSSSDPLSHMEIVQNGRTSQGAYPEVPTSEENNHTNLPDWLQNSYTETKEDMHQDIIGPTVDSLPKDAEITMTEHIGENSATNNISENRIESLPNWLIESAQNIPLPGENNISPSQKDQIENSTISLPDSQTLHPETLNAPTNTMDTPDIQDTSRTGVTAQDESRKIHTPKPKNKKPSTSLIEKKDSSIHTPSSTIDSLELKKSKKKSAQKKKKTESSSQDIPVDIPNWLK